MPQRPPKRKSSPKAASTAAAARELFQVIGRESIIDALSESGLKPAEVSGKIDLRDAHFSYPSRLYVPVFLGHGISIPAKKITALVGTSGSDSFSGTIYDNVARGFNGLEMVILPVAEKEKLVKEACKAAFAHGFIEDLPQTTSFVFSSGAVVEQGTHSHFVAANGAYAWLVRAQDFGQDGIEAERDGGPIQEEKQSGVAIQRTITVISGAGKMAQAIRHYYSLHLFDIMARQRMTFFDDPQNSTGALVSRLFNEPTNLMELLSMNLGLILVHVVNMRSSCVLAIAFGWKLGRTLFFGAIQLLILGGYLKGRLEFRLDKRHVRFASSSGIASKATRAIPTVAYLTLEADVIGRYQDALTGIEKKSLGGLESIMFWYALSQAVSFLAMALGSWYGGHLISRGEYTARQFYVVFLSIIFSGEATAMLIQFSSSMSKARISPNYIFDLRKRLARDEAADMDHGKDIPEAVLSYTFDQPNFAFGRRPLQRALKDVFGLMRGSRVLLNGEYIAGLDLRKHRSHISVVQQEQVLYEVSIQGIVGLGLEEDDPSEEDIIAAYKHANIYDFITSLPEDLKQVVKEALYKAAQGRTTIAVSHRLSNIKDAGLIVVFVNGKIVESGTHEDLLDRRGLYYDMCQGQMLDRSVA
ncbi:hypothetical protein jhhlp_000587 [Lomentospora prolificans]|uniref:ABC transmembrane type-1 domain-containing protein n=1 Tax=Lomentospora prolificans TaxID=41688 RepID=A0A2N3NIX4_9PEZI|nr:hypothetical protein jhhlp_000587 [Lomentospora prolificans]